jgi:hypothetical protein
LALVPEALLEADRAVDEGMRPSSLKLEIKLVPRLGRVADMAGVAGREWFGVDMPSEMVESRCEGVFGAGGKAGWCERYAERKLTCSAAVGYLLVLQEKGYWVS